MIYVNMKKTNTWILVRIDWLIHIQSRRFSNINLYLALLLSSCFTISKKTHLSHSRKGGTVHSSVTWGAKPQTSTQLFLRKRLIKPPPGLPQIHDGVPKQNGQNPCCLLVKRLESAAFFSLRSIRRNRWPQSFLKVKKWNGLGLQLNRGHYILAKWESLQKTTVDFREITGGFL